VHQSASCVASTRSATTLHNAKRSKACSTNLRALINPAADPKPLQPLYGTYSAWPTPAQPPPSRALAQLARSTHLRLGRVVQGGVHFQRDLHARQHGAGERCAQHLRRGVKVLRVRSDGGGGAER